MHSFFWLLELSHSFFKGAIASVEESFLKFSTLDQSSRQTMSVIKIFTEQKTFSEFRRLYIVHLSLEKKLTRNSL